jgi:hypothetical protein
MPRDNVTAIIFVMSDVLLDAVHEEILMDDGPQNPSDTKFVQQLSKSASLRHLLLICMASSCHWLHQELRGVSPVKGRTAAAAVTSSAAVAAAAAAAESDKQQQQGEAEQRYLTVPSHHTAVLEMLLAPAIAEGPVQVGRPKAMQLQHAMQATIEFLLLINNSGSTTSSSSGNIRRLGKVTELPRIPVQLCLLLHMLLCEAAALAPELPGMHMALIFQMSLLDIYVQVCEVQGVKLGTNFSIV